MTPKGAPAPAGAASAPPPDKLREECGVFGLWSPAGGRDAADEIYRGLLALQHRGQESAGITVGADGLLQTEKGMGLISQVFTGDILETLKGHMGIGHVRYSTAGAEDLEHAQPLEARGKLGSLAVAHNGTLVNADILRSLLEDGGVLFRTRGDTEVLLAMIARRADHGLESAVTETMSAVKGSYALVMAVGDKLIGTRDPHGIRPMVLGRRDNRWYLASESCALNAVGAATVRDVAPGEVILIDQDGPRSVEQDMANTRATCVFEYIYFARPDSRIDSISVMDSRLAMGRELSREWDIEADIVCGVPDSGVPAALGFARQSGIPYGMGFLKNHYVGRTFIHPDQAMRERAVSVKLTASRRQKSGENALSLSTIPSSAAPPAAVWFPLCAKPAPNRLTSASSPRPSPAPATSASTPPSPKTLSPTAKTSRPSGKSSVPIPCATSALPDSKKPWPKTKASAWAA